ncbi:MAG: hypothetical protein IPM98_06320 [Lewinellaceae bacterium]|nr:hypothetical protein [Lewinellaceae bacterium]
MDVDAGQNQWEVDNLGEFLEYIEDSTANLSNIYDAKDNPAKGLVDVNPIF